MTHAAFYEKTRKRLEQYGIFSAATLNFAALKAEALKQYPTYQKLFKTVGISNPTLFMNSQGRGVPLVDLDPREAEKGVFVVHLPMANPLDANQLYQVAALALAFPAYRIIAFGNPSGRPYKFREQNLSFIDWLRVAFTKNRRALVSTELDYLAGQNIRGAYHIGYSFGALKALTAVYYASPESTEGVVLIDPVAHARYFKQLVGDFQATFEPLGEYVDRTELETFLEARKDAVHVNHMQGLRRMVNIAIGIMLSRVELVEYLQDTLAKHSQLKAYVAWGSKSELGNDAHMKANLHNIVHDTAKGRAGALRLDGARHAFANDLPLYIAIVQDFVGETNAPVK